MKAFVQMEHLACTLDQLRLMGATDARFNPDSAIVELAQQQGRLYPAPAN